MDHVNRDGFRAEQVVAALRSLDAVSDGGPVSELQHALQVATWAERSGADEDLVLAALVHDIGKVFGDQGHGAMATALLAPHVRHDDGGLGAHPLDLRPPSAAWATATAIEPDRWDVTGSPTWSGPG